jgi:hypothetical protein
MPGKPGRQMANALAKAPCGKALWKRNDPVVAVAVAHRVDRLVDRLCLAFRSLSHCSSRVRP